MPICPLSTDWGNVADWFAVVVAAAGAAAVWLVTKASNSTARASHELAKQLKERDEEVRLRDRAVLTALIYGEILEAKTSYADLLEELVTGNGFEWAVKTQDRINHLIEWSKGPGLVRIKENTQRLNLLPQKLGEQIAMGIGMTDLCPRNAEALLFADTKEEQLAVFERLVASVDGAQRAFEAAHLQIKELMGTSQGD